MSPPPSPKLPLSLAALQACLVVGGLAMAVLWVPFTLTHGPTSIYIEEKILGLDMHRWGFPPGRRAERADRVGPVAAPRRLRRKAALVVTTAMCVALFVSAAFDLAFRALGPPFMPFVLAPTTLAAALTAPMASLQRPARVLLGTLALLLVAALGLALVPLEISDRFNGYRVFGALAYGLPGLVWALLGVAP